MFKKNLTNYKLLRFSYFTYVCWIRATNMSEKYNNAELDIGSKNYYENIYSFIAHENVDETMGNVYSLLAYTVDKFSILSKDRAHQEYTIRSNSK